MAETFGKKEVVASVAIALLWFASISLFNLSFSYQPLPFYAFFAINAFFMVAAAYFMDRRWTVFLMAAFLDLLVLPFFFLEKYTEGAMVMLAYMVLVLASSLVFDLLWYLKKSDYRFAYCSSISQLSISVFLWVLIAAMDPQRIPDPSMLNSTVNFALLSAGAGLGGGIIGALFWGLVRTNKRIIRFQLTR